ncbi:hypothetical protein A3A95_03190 [Candidatus Nomurabacteria bacterium RIFCSPLOWO2_01_FULL_39_18]|uniref:DUF805 domain-containing protein n=1 Tax=Candidatus Nomurabacteria bacterium RIFCSPHIGHO2_01_FULL_40_24b TaxID=1801739 RepID=A0A1F6V7N5_9BACT|nr:MAG: hypothetical protein A2647_03370 [Candidatus Nomurabacteria bacterium RIFCSPHIGHO2_01_FULL_40_24b]OGI89659.1 MAG: hypothetical protein A3A95_03190 [Candidatus Nomurabacteria bacterium RIFCSPLOWO2_01_FULL_39_18]
MDNFIGVLKKYAVFKGRAGRREYWMFVLVSLIVSIVLSILDGIFGLKLDKDTGVLSSLYSLAVFLPTLGVSIRRLHDTNHSGWWILAPSIAGLITVGLFFLSIFQNNYVPLIIGGIVTLILGVALVIFFVLDSNPGENKYGPNPKEVVSTPTPAPTATV